MRSSRGLRRVEARGERAKRAPTPHGVERDGLWEGRDAKTADPS